MVALFEEAKEPAAPIVRVKMDPRLARDADVEAACAVLVDESEGR